MEADKRMEGIWCVDSETGLQYLLDLKTGTILARKDSDGNIVNERAD